MEERACAVVQGERGRQGVWKLPGDQVDELYYAELSTATLLSSAATFSLGIATVSLFFRPPVTSGNATAILAE